MPAPIAPAPKTTAPTPTIGDMDCDNGPKAGRRKADLNRSSEDLKRVRISEVPEAVMIPAHGEDDQQPLLPLQQEPNAPSSRTPAAVLDPLYKLATCKLEKKKDLSIPMAS